MNKKIKLLLIVLLSSFMLAGLVVLIYLLDPTFVPNLYSIFSLVYITLCAFFIIPTLCFLFSWVKKKYEEMTLEQSFRNGVFIGLYLVSVAILCFLFSPLIGSIWYIETIKEKNSEI